MTRQRIDELERRARLVAPTLGDVVIEAVELAEFVESYRRHRKRCASCGFERCEHLSSPACAGFSESTVKPYIAPSLHDAMCTMCMARGKRMPAQNVATDADGLQWFECGDHGENDNFAQVIRTEIESLEAWRARHL